MNRSGHTAGQALDGREADFPAEAILRRHGKCGSGGRVLIEINRAGGGGKGESGQRQGEIGRLRFDSAGTYPGNDHHKGSTRPGAADGDGERRRIGAGNRGWAERSGHAGGRAKNVRGEIDCATETVPRAELDRAGRTGGPCRNVECRRGSGKREVGCGSRGRQVIDQCLTVGAAPSGDQIVASNSVVTFEAGTCATGKTVDSRSARSAWG